MAATGDGLESKDLQTMISDREIKKEMREMVQKMFSIPPDWMHKSYFNVSMSKQLKRRYCLRMLV